MLKKQYCVHDNTKRIWHAFQLLEYLLGVLCGEGIDNLLVEVDSELPIMDGSANEFVNKIKKLDLKITIRQKNILKYKRNLNTEMKISL